MADSLSLKGKKLNSSKKVYNEFVISLFTEAILIRKPILLVGILIAVVFLSSCSIAGWLVKGVETDLDFSVEFEAPKSTVEEITDGRKEEQEKKKKQTLFIPTPSIVQSSVSTTHHRSSSGRDSGSNGGSNQENETIDNDGDDLHLSYADLRAMDLIAEYKQKRLRNNPLEERSTKNRRGTTGTAQKIHVRKHAENILINKIHGIYFSPLIEGQDRTDMFNEEQIKERIDIIEPYTEWIRTIGCGGNFKPIGKIAKKAGLKTVIAAWIDKEGVNGWNDIEINNLIDIANEGYANIVVVGGETLLRDDFTVEELIEYINQVRNEISEDVPITTAEAYNEILNNKELIAAVDTIVVNYYPFWEGIDINNAIDYIAQQHEHILEVADGKAVIIGETGWPSKGESVGNAIPSEENAKKYFVDFVSWAKENNIPYFYFGAFDEDWKNIDGATEANFGVWYQNGTMKSGREEVFE